ncbi:MAG: AlkZ-related protein [bacterium]
MCSSLGEPTPSKERRGAGAYSSNVLSLTSAAVERYRRALVRQHTVRTQRGALRFINTLGFCYAFTRGPGGLPGLFDVLATRSTDRMWSWAWEWKDVLATSRRVHYGKVIRRKPSYISLALLPAFYALSGNVGEPDDHLQAYREGRLSALSKAVYEHILAAGPVSTWTLRRQFVPRGQSGGRFHRALDDLQERFLVAKVGEEDEWRYGFIWDAFHRWMPDVVRAADALTSEAAAAAILRRYVGIMGAAAPSEIEATLGWSPTLARAAAALAGLDRALLEGREAWTVGRRRWWRER